MWPGNSNNNRTEDEEEEQEKDSLAWNIVSKKKSRERSWKKMMTEQTERDSLPTILETISDNEAHYSSAEDEDWRATSVSPAGSPLLRSLIKPSYLNKESSRGPGVSGVRTHPRQQHKPVVKPPIQTNSHCCGHDAARENTRVCPLAMKLDNIQDKSQFMRKRNYGYNAGPECIQCKGYLDSLPKFLQYFNKRNTMENPTLDESHLELINGANACRLRWRGRESHLKQILSPDEKIQAVNKLPEKLKSEEELKSEEKLRSIEEKLEEARIKCRNVEAKLECLRVECSNYISKLIDTF